MKLPYCDVSSNSYKAGRPMALPKVKIMFYMRRTYGEVYGLAHYSVSIKISNINNMSYAKYLNKYGEIFN